MTSTNGRLAGGKLYTDINITGDVTKRGNEFNLNGHTLNIEGNLYQELGTITPSTGKLLVSGDYMIVSDHDSAVFGTSDGILNMVNNGDYVLVGGSFVTKSTKDHTKNLTAGTMEIKGDFTQLGGGTAKAFPASGTHEVILSGDNTQKVTFESYPDSHFNILKLTKDASSYEFSPEECWNELVSETAPPETTEPETEPGSEPSTSEPVTEEAPVGDANGDNVIDLKDVMVIRRFYAGGWDVTINEKAADVNHDGTVDLKDALIIRRYYAGGWDIELK